jgi:hypothetical protein
MTTRMTKREMFNGVLTLLGKFDHQPEIQVYRDGILHEISLLDKKSNAKPNPKLEAAREAVKQEIQMELLSQGAMRATAIHAAGVGSSVQQVTALLRQMVADGIVTRTQDKKVVTFSIE